MENIPITQIDAHAFPRDRSILDQSAMDELLHSISRDGLRTPIEVVQTDTGYALLSGYRRLATVQKLAELNDKWSTIAAFVRTPEDIGTTLRLIAEENAVRADISPWDQSRYAVQARNMGHFETLDAAIDALYPSINRQKHSRLRAVAEVVEHFEGILTDPQDLKQYQLTRLAAAIRGDFTDLMQQALAEHRDKSAGGQWQTLDRILAEAEAEANGTLPTYRKSGKPIRIKRLTQNLTVRRVYQPDGWTLVFTGSEAHGTLIKRVLDDLIHNYSPKP